jgi:hypothetical protein
VDAELGRDLSAVDDEGFRELVLHLDEFPQGRVGQAQDAQYQRGHGTEFAVGVAGVLVDRVDELASGLGVGVVGQVPHLAGGVGVFAEGGEAFTDVGDVGVGVGLVGVAEHGGGLAGQGGREDPVAEVGLGAAAGTVVVRRAADRDLDPPGLVGGEEFAGHPGPQLALLGVCGVGAVLSQWLPVGPAVPRLADAVQTLTAVLG